MTRDPRVDAYIAAAAPFAQPILTEIRRRMHAAAPGLDEDLKWRMPAFLRAGRQIAGMAAFKAHCALSFAHLEANVDGGRAGMGQFGRIISLDDLPDEQAFATIVREAVRLADSGARLTPYPTRARPQAPVAMPEDFAAALDAAGARAAFDALAPGYRREYLEWIAGAKQPATRARRIARAVEEAREGRSLNARYRR